MIANTELTDGALAGLIQQLQARGARVVRAEQGLALDLGAGARLELIDDDHTLLLISGNARFAIIPDVRSTRAPRRPELASLSGIILPNASAVAWLQDIDVMVVVVDGPNPMPSNISSPKFLATDERGWIEMVTDGKSLWLWTQHPERGD